MSIKRNSSLSFSDVNDHVDSDVDDHVDSDVDDDDGYYDKYQYAYRPCKIRLCHNFSHDIVPQKISYHKKVIKKLK